ncbi:MAG: chemotaxis response regulator protein-glutamate methylesterase [Desulfitobacterium sp.]|nr:chemotaxis response regulator protein-glutamate methylesterase [Desulfitobacterium sp.]
MRHKGPIKVLVVDDSPFMRLTIQKILNQDPEIRVVDTARDGLEGIEKLQALNPQVITMDIEMPNLNGLQALNEIMRWKPTPVIILSALTTEGAEASMQALEAGAFDIVAKPSGGTGSNLEVLAEEILAKVKAAAQVDPQRLGKKGRGIIPPASQLGGRKRVTSSTSRVKSTKTTPSPTSFKRVSTINNIGTNESSTLKTPLEDTVNPLPKHPVEIVAIGTSTGGPSALQEVLTKLPGDFPVPILVAQHMPPGFTKPLAKRLDGLSQLTVREGIHGETLKAGTVYFAPAGKQMQVNRRGGQLQLHIGDESPIPTLYSPSVDVMFMSLAKEVGKGTLGVVMTGMGSDGLKGMQEIKGKEGFAIAEAEETCVVYGMPRAIIEGKLADRISPLGEIARNIMECVQRR